MAILIATKNQGKIKEYKTLLKGTHLEVLTLNDLPEVRSPEENRHSYYENALIKAKYYYDIFGIPTLSDDSGIEVDVLNGEPGIHSARFSGKHATEKSNRIKMLAQLKPFFDQDQPITACFKACLVFYDGHNPISKIGIIKGQIISEERGKNGFGYDAIFYIPKAQKTAAEMNDVEKNNYSHRGRACQLMVPILHEFVMEEKNRQLAQASLWRCFPNEPIIFNGRLTGGMSNFSYLFTIANHQYLVRIPGQYSECFISRTEEKCHTSLMASLIPSPKVYLFDEKTGIVVRDYLGGTPLKSFDTVNVKQVASLLKKIHESGVVSPYDYAPFTRLHNYYAAIGAIGGSVSEVYSQLFDRFSPYIAQLKARPLVLCHGDSQVSNVVSLANGDVTLVDFEFSGNNDCYYDIACFGNNDVNLAVDLLEAYLGRIPTDQEKIILYAWRTFQALQWYLVAIHKDVTQMSRRLNFDFKEVANFYLEQARWCLDVLDLLQK